LIFLLKKTKLILMSLIAWKTLLKKIESSCTDRFQGQQSLAYVDICTMQKMLT